MKPQTFLWSLLLPFSPVSAESVLPPELFTGRTAAAVRTELEVDATTAGGGFAVALVDLLAGVEALCQEMHGLGLNYQFARELPVPVFRMQLPVKAGTEPVRPEQVRAVIDRFEDCLRRVDERLAALPAEEFKTVVPLSAISLDFNGDGTVGEAESFAVFMRGLSGRRPAAGETPPPGGPDVTVAFDRADATWLRAYSHLLRGVLDTLLAHDGGELFEAAGQAFFVHADTAMARLLATNPEPDSNQRRRALQGDRIADAIGLIHGIDLPVADPARLAGAREHFLTAAKLSRETLDAIAAETDNDREWLPGPTQSSAFGLTLTAAQADGWRTLLGELDDLLEGRKLLPHWRFPGERGLNVKRWFLESRHTDLILLVQGADAVPFIESGEPTRGATWREITRLFGGNFLGYALWIN
ncbi:MAG: hypothetical protein ABII82_17315 [Verrucomicrobiota bacterium]